MAIVLDSALAQIQQQDWPPGLYIVAVPIGNMGDITLRALVGLQKADLVLCEDTRVGSRLLRFYGIPTPCRAYHDHNGEKMRPSLLAQLAQGQKICLISDAGTPLVSDPGYKLVQAAQQDGHYITVLPGATAILPALILSALPCDRFAFCGFLPAQQAARRTFLQRYQSDTHSLIFFETATRLRAALADILQVFGDRKMAVCRELTKKFEQTYHGTVSELQQLFSQSDESNATGTKIKGEMTLVIAGASPASKEDMCTELEESLEHMRVKEAVQHIKSRYPHIGRQEIYRQALQLQDKK